MRHIFTLLSILYCIPCAAVVPMGMDNVITQQIQHEIDSLSNRGGGTLSLSPGIYCTGSIHLKSNVNLHLDKDVVLLGSINPYDYDGYGNDFSDGKLPHPFALITASSVKNISITGSGTIDGRGLELALAIDSLHHTKERIDPFYNVRRMRPDLRPKLIDFEHVEDILIENVRLRASASWGLSMIKCNNVAVRDIDFVNRAYWNNDGIDIDDCHDVEITGCSINAADDGICLKSSDPKDSNNRILIENNSIASSASAIKMGTGSFGGFRNITIRNNKVRDTFRSAIAIESVDGATIENIIVDSLDAVNTGNALFIRLGYRHGEAPGSIRNVSISNLTCEVPFGRPDSDYDLRGPDISTIHNPFPASITGIPGHLVEDIKLSNVTVSYPGRGTKGMAYIGEYRYNDVPEVVDAYPEFHMFGELPAWGLFLRHVDGITFDNVTMTAREPDYRPVMVAADDVHNITGKINE